MSLRLPIHAFVFLNWIRLFSSLRHRSHIQISCVTTVHQYSTRNIFSMRLCMMKHWERLQFRKHCSIFWCEEFMPFDRIDIFKAWYILILSLSPAFIEIYAFPRNVLNVDRKLLVSNIYLWNFCRIDRKISFSIELNDVLDFFLLQMFFFSKDRKPKITK